MQPVVIITGASSGIGRFAAQALAERGAKVYSLSRRAEAAPGVCARSVDVTDPDAVRAAVDGVLAREGRIDVLINNAGMGISGAVEFTAADASRRLFDVNYFGADAMVRAVLPAMRAAGRGRVVNIGSVAGQIAIPFQAHYSAAKAAINAYSMALLGEVSPYGISVCAVMPGDTRTGFTGAREKLHEGDCDYGGRIGRSVSRMERDELRGMTAERAGRMVARIALKRRVRPLITLGASYKLLAAVSRLLPASVLARIVGYLYAR